MSSSDDELDTESADDGTNVPGNGARANPVSFLTRFLRLEASGGIVLLVATVVALVWVNLPGAIGHSYEAFWEHALILDFGLPPIAESIEGWVNDALMTVFFFVVGLEIKRELVTGELRDPRAAALPGLAAIGGMLVPALIYVAFNAGGAGSAGWGIPMATDIAFVVGVIALMGSRIPSGVKLFMLTLAIVDDIGAIVVIAIFYTADLELIWLIPAVIGCVLIVVLTKMKIRFDIVYFAIGVVVWYSTFESGIHATLAGVVLGLLAPAKPIKGRIVIEHLEEKLAPLTSFVIIPIFALANAGVPLNAEVLGVAFSSPITWGIIVALFVGNTIGISALTGAGLGLKIGRLPTGVKYRHVLAASTLGGIGFTVSLFIASLTFAGAEQVLLLDAAKIGILAGSLLSGIVGSLAVLVVLKRSETSSMTPATADAS